MERKSNKQQKLHIKTGDTVKVISGDSKGKTGKVLSVNVLEKKAIVEGINIVTRHVKPTAQKPQGGIVKKEAPLAVSKLMLVDPATGEATKTGRKLDKNGKLQRFSKKTGEIISNG